MSSFNQLSGDKLILQIQFGLQTRVEMLEGLDQQVRLIVLQQVIQKLNENEIKFWRSIIG